MKIQGYQKIAPGQLNGFDQRYRKCKKCKAQYVAKQDRDLFCSKRCARAK